MGWSAMLKHGNHRASFRGLLRLPQMQIRDRLLLDHRRNRLHTFLSHQPRECDRANSHGIVLQKLTA
jgi:hypothetical protein